MRWLFEDEAEAHFKNADVRKAHLHAAKTDPKRIRICAILKKTGASITLGSKAIQFALPVVDDAVDQDFMEDRSGLDCFC